MEANNSLKREVAVTSRQASSMENYAMDMFENLVQEIEEVKQPVEKIAIMSVMQCVLQQGIPGMQLPVLASTKIATMILEDDNEEEVKVLTEAVRTLLAFARVSRKATSKIEEMNVVGRLVKLGRDYPEASGLQYACFQCVCMVFKKCKRQVLRDLGHDPNITMLWGFHSPCPDRTRIGVIETASRVLEMLSLEPARPEARLKEVQTGLNGATSNEEHVDLKYNLRHVAGIEAILACARGDLELFDGDTDTIAPASTTHPVTEHGDQYGLCEQGGYLRLSTMTVRIPGRWTHAQVRALKEVKHDRFSRALTDTIAKIAGASQGDVSGDNQASWALQSRAFSAMIVVAFYTPELIATAEDDEFSMLLKRSILDGTQIAHTNEARSCREGDVASKPSLVLPPSPRPEMHMNVLSPCGTDLMCKNTFSCERLFRAVGSMFFTTTSRASRSSPSVARYSPACQKPPESGLPRDHREIFLQQQGYPTISSVDFVRIGSPRGNDTWVRVIEETCGPGMTSQHPHPRGSWQRISSVTKDRGAGLGNTWDPLQGPHDDRRTSVLWIFLIFCIAVITTTPSNRPPPTTVRLEKNLPVSSSQVPARVVDPEQGHLDASHDFMRASSHSGVRKTIPDAVHRIGTDAQQEERRLDAFLRSTSYAGNGTCPLANVIVATSPATKEYCQPKITAKRVVHSPRIYLDADEALVRDSCHVRLNAVGANVIQHLVEDRRYAHGCHIPASDPTSGYVFESCIDTAAPGYGGSDHRGSDVAHARSTRHYQTPDSDHAALRNACRRRVGAP